MKKKLLEKRDSIVPIVLGIVIFAFIVTFYTHFHPLYIFDTDDWTYIAQARNPWPNTGDWNPTKVLPETLMPLISTLGVWLIMPFTHDYVGSICIALAIIVALLLSIYFVSIYAVIKEKLKIKNALVLAIVLGIVLLHFMPIGGGGEASYLLYSSSVNNYFNYIVAAIWNAILVLFAVRRNDEIIMFGNNKLLGSIAILWIYFAINSNLFHSIIIAVYGGVIILLDIIKAFAHKNWGGNKPTKKRLCMDFNRNNLAGFLLA